MNGSEETKNTIRNIALACAHLEEDSLWRNSTYRNLKTNSSAPRENQKHKHHTKGKGKKLRQRDFLSFEQLRPQYEGLGYNDTKQLRPELAKIRGLGNDGIVSASPAIFCKSG